MSKRRFLFIGAHPDDADILFGGTALQLCKAGHVVKFLSMSTGAGGHFSLSREETAARRKLEAAASAKYAGLEEYQVFDSNGPTEASIANREKILRVIRRFAPDMVITHRGIDYHPDHRACSQLVLDTAYLVTVPHYCEDSPIPEKVPVYAFSYDLFDDPRPHRADAAIPFDSVIDEKIALLSCHESQFFEWLPWNQGEKDFDVNKLSPEELKQWFLGKSWFTRFEKAAEGARDILKKFYGEEEGGKVRYAEVFEFSPYGKKCSKEEFQQMLMP